MLFLFRSFLHTYQNNRSQILFLKPNCFYCETSNQHNSSFLKRCIVVVVEESTKGMFRRVRRGLGLKKFLVFRSSVFRKCVAPIMYIAVRVDSKAAARKVMENFSTDGELLGFKVEMTWFRDIRRYLAHCAKQGSRPSRFRGRSDYRRDDEQYKGRGRSRSPTRSPEREEGARSRSASAASRHSNANRRRSQSRSHSARSHSHSRSLSSGGEVRAARDGNASHSEREKSLDYSDIEEKKVRLSPPRVLSPSPPPLKKSKKEKRKKEKRQRRSKRRLRWPTTASLTRARTWKWAGRRRTDCPTAEDAKCSKWSHRRPSTTAAAFVGRPPPSPLGLGHGNGRGGGGRTVQRRRTQNAQNGVIVARQQQQGMWSTGARCIRGLWLHKLRNHSYVQPLLYPLHMFRLGVSPPKFKPIGELSDYQQQINGSQVSNIRFAAPPPQPPLVLRNLPLPPVTTNNEMMVDRTCRNNTAKPSASDFGLAG
ncbi:hypothetical protein niasHS_008599 [Heterodera schachtii]|uniref:Uncharacterized protein n=1 Tax=Heterodera schachtii TaxID=97005 RepID=A0ABD2J8D7_HETSC